MTKKIPIGISDFKRIIDEKYHYVDKSMLIEEIVNYGSTIILIPRPRRFGKTLNMYMLKYFFEKTKEDNSVLFHELKIWKNEAMRQLQGKYPVIFLSFKDVKYMNWEDCISQFRILLQYLYGEHRYLLDGGILENQEIEYYQGILAKKTDISELTNSIRNLCEYLHRYHGEKPVILLDEYDTPIYSAWINGYYDKLIDFIRNLMSLAFKDNQHLEKAVLTGIMRVGKESIFSGMNNLNVATIISHEYSDKFGFTEEETKSFLDAVGIGFEMDDVRDWYNGYVFGKTVIYNPWSIICYVHKHSEGFKPHWVNTGSSDLIRDILTRAGTDVKEDMEILINGGDIVKTVYDNTVITDIERSSETIWSFLLFSGYLKAVETWRVETEEETKCKLKIPNRELKYVFNEIIRYWIGSGINASEFDLMLKSLVNGDIMTFEDILADQVERSISYYDVAGNEPERFYHAFVLGMLMRLEDSYQVRSNRESGRGRYDIMLIPKDKSRNGVVLEFKSVNKRRNETLETACDEALRQIREKNYRAELEALGVTKIYEVGIAFLGKQVRVVQG